jgi:hypothetical protein
MPVKPFNTAVAACLLVGLSSVFGVQFSVVGTPLTLQADSGEVRDFSLGAKLFSNRSYTALAVPDSLAGTKFIYTGIDTAQVIVCSEPGVLYAVTPADHPDNSLADYLISQGFEQLPDEPALLFGTAANDTGYVYRKTLQKGDVLNAKKWILFFSKDDLTLTPYVQTDWSRNDGELLYNGIRLPTTWPPLFESAESTAPMDVPYLDSPPDVISIDVGRQLFVDDFLVEATDLEQTFHLAEKYTNNPVFKPETAEEQIKSVCYLGHGGVFYDYQDQLIKMWYSAGVLDGALAFATSPDAISWTRPDLGLPAGGNLVLPRGGRTAGDHAGGDNCVWLDTQADSAAERIKFMVERASDDPHWLLTSPDNTTWSEPVGAGLADDYSSFFLNPFRDVWVYSIKRNGSRGRCRDYAESPEFLTQGAFDSSVYWCNTDELDEPDPEEQEPAQLYSLGAVAYESLMLGVFYVHLGPPNSVCAAEKRPKITELKLGFSRDGFHWFRPDRRAFIAAERTEGTWDRAYLHSTAGVCLINGDQLVFPYCGFSGVTSEGEQGMYYGAGIGLATLRRDGFASMDADANGGTLTTRLLQFSGKHVFVNVDAPGGTLRMEIQDDLGNPIEPFTLENSVPLSADSTVEKMEWNNGADLSTLAGTPVRFHFELTNGSLYYFWVSRDESGRSDGYLAGGGLGYSGPVDTDGTQVFE